jgi:hypothetical protein
MLPSLPPLSQGMRHTGQFPDPQKSAEDLHAFAKSNEGRLYKLLKTCMDPQTDLKGLDRATVGRIPVHLDVA